MKIFQSLSVLLLTIPCFAQTKEHSELKDLGYFGKIHSVTTTIHDAPTDSLVSVNTRYYNVDGNATKETYTIGDYSHEVIYQYKNNTKTGYDLLNHGERTIYGKITYQKTGYTISNYNATDGLVLKAVYLFDDIQKTKSIEHIIYASDGNIMKRSITDYYYDSSGFIKGYTVKDLIDSKSDSYDFEILTKDDYKNPNRLRLLKNKQPYQIHHIDISYL